MQVESIKGTIQSVTADLVNNVVLYDKDFFPDDRKAFIRNWILEEETVAVVIVDNEYSSNVLVKFQPERMVVVSSCAVFTLIAICQVTIYLSLYYQ